MTLDLLHLIHRVLPFLLCLLLLQLECLPNTPRLVAASCCTPTPCPVAWQILKLSIRIGVCAGSKAVVDVLLCCPQRLMCWKACPQCGMGGLGPLRGPTYREVIVSLVVFGNPPCLVLRKGAVMKERIFHFLVSGFSSHPVMASPCLLCCCLP